MVQPRSAVVTGAAQTARRSWWVPCQKSDSQWLDMKLQKITVEYHILKTKTINTQNASLLIISLHFAIICGLDATMYICSSWVVEICHHAFSPPPHSKTILHTAVGFDLSGGIYTSEIGTCYRDQGLIFFFFCFVDRLTQENDGSILIKEIYFKTVMSVAVALRIAQKLRRHFSSI